ncbi:MAG: MOSC domain-containing protein [Acidobacteriota bacterium]|jgi:MOSC domain-containing protein YiiM
MTLRIHTQLVGLPREITDGRGTWRSAIFKDAVAGPVELGPRHLAGDGSEDRDSHGTPAKAVCCHPMAHYALWNEEYSLAGTDGELGPGSVGENWTVEGGTEEDVAIGDVFAVGSARVQVSAPRGPCWKQERRLGLDGFVRRTLETLRTGYYLRVLTPGVVRAGDELRLEERPHPELTVHAALACAHRRFDPELARRFLEAPELDPAWAKHLRKAS